MIVAHTPAARRGDKNLREDGWGGDRAYLKMMVGKVNATVYPPCTDDERFDK